MTDIPALPRTLRDRLAVPTRILPVAILVVLLIAITLRSPGFLSLNSIQVLLASASVFALLATGQLVVILMGRIDLSTGAMAALGTVLLAKWLPTLGVWAIVFTLACLTLAGLVNGLVHTWAQIPSFVVTLGALGLWSGVALVVSGANAISVNKGYSLIQWTTGFLGPVPREVLLAGVVLAGLGAFLRLTVPGRQVYAIGLAEQATMMSGVRVRTRVIGAFALSGLAAGLASMVLVGQQISGDPLAAQSLLLPSIAAVVIGRASCRERV